MLCALLISDNEKTINKFQLEALKFGCVLKVVENQEDINNFAADTPFTAIFLDTDNIIEFDYFAQLCDMISNRFIKGELFLFSISNNRVIDNNIYSVINGYDAINEVFSNIFPNYLERTNNILSSLRICNCEGFENIYKGRRLLAIFPNTTECITEKILSAFPVNLLPDGVDFFSDGSSVFAMVDTNANNLNRICYHVIIELHSLNLSAFALYSECFESFNQCCQLFSGINSYAVKLRLEDNNKGVYFYNKELSALEPFGNIVKKAQITGNKITSCNNEEKILALVNAFFNHSQIVGVSIVNLQFLVCEILRSAFGDELLYNNLFSIISSKNADELKRLLISICAKEKISQLNLEVSDSERIILQICEIIENEYANELYLDRVAEQIYLSPAYISRIFKKSTGMNFVKYLNEVRLKKAAALLIEDDYPINEISKMVGFSDVSYFCSCFKKKYGMTTVQYRRAYVLKEIEV